MRRISPAVSPLLLVCGMVMEITALPGFAQQGGAEAQKLRAAAAKRSSLTGSVTSSLKRGLDKFTDLITPKIPEKQAPDAVALATPANPTAKLYVSVAQLYENEGQLAQAAQQYQKALQLEPNRLAALLGYARVKDRQEKPQEAARLYQKAARLYPQDASVFNNMGAFYGRRGQMGDALRAMERAIQLQPKEAKYRNNMAVLLVEIGQIDKALSHLQAVSPKAVAFYNLGFLLHKKGQTQAAMQQFALALQIDPTLGPARDMMQRVASTAGAQLASSGQPRRSVRVSTRPDWALSNRRPAPPQTASVRQLPPPPGRPPSATPTLAPNRSSPLSHQVNQLPPPTLHRQLAPAPRRLPPTSGGPSSAGDLPPLPKGPLPARPETPTAPMPPPSANGPVLTPLPRVN